MTPTYQDIDRTYPPRDNDLPAPAILLDWVRSHLHSRPTRPKPSRFDNRIYFPVVNRDISKLLTVDFRQIMLGTQRMAR